VPETLARDLLAPPGHYPEQEAQATGLSLDEIRSRSFVKIMAARRAGA